MKEIKVGDHVQWICKPYNFLATGRVVKIFESTVGACKKCLCAKIYILTVNYPHDRSTTTIAIHNLKRLI